MCVCVQGSNKQTLNSNPNPNPNPFKKIPYPFNPIISPYKQYITFFIDIAIGLVERHFLQPISMKKRIAQMILGSVKRKILLEMFLSMKHLLKNSSI